MDLISRQAAIAHAISGRTRELDGEKWIRVSEVRESLQTMPSAQPEQIARDIATILENERDMRVMLKNAEQRWIPCIERMPNPNELNGNVIKYYLVQNVFGDMLVCNWNGKEWGLIYSYETEVPEDVVAWMPLPEPYKGREDE